ncbi:MAG TPA: hypothetical protein DCP38_15815, partial [Acidobacteria bacterium]|nr:hypothetical protein [Acidobacteriota bacterium]
RSFDPGVDTQQWVRHVGAEWRADFLTAGATYLDVGPNFRAPDMGGGSRRGLGSWLKWQLVVWAA